MKDIVLPPIEALIDIHAELLEEHGGAPGLTDRGALEMSLARPQQIQAYADGDPTIFDLAGALCISILRNHPFVDGNKRIGFAALGMALEMNGFHLDVSEREAVDKILAVVEESVSEEAFHKWVAQNSFKN